ncbi:nucleoside-diphosphate-sugar epimerase [Ruminiclostridium sufflavum DSM 19573]|uniref:Nucleoside-diphosphate-sugar epimerase n=1 Tax=Ruminiclostridium sufflavum DSM 19573 TaxID=1121337 RepID=A0A318XMC6_9FIRM|nr:NAD(P)-dependent oxidoreductase [Ruminiclostridium sufflavum]PYG87794.1 nucleoside-diphosphate-sugar epimerase [Ruminiclostridium sufflavum DSM 19573]
MKKVIVTGANGFVGTALLNEITKEGVEVIAVIRNGEENVAQIENLPGVRLVYCELSEITRLPQIVEDRDIEACIHLAWEGSSGDVRADYKVQLRNVRYSLDLINAIAGMKVKRFTGAGTLAEKDVLNYHPTAGAVPNAVSIYGIAKMTMHFMTKAECTRLGVEHIWCYLSNTYGIGNRTENFVNFASRLMLTGKRAAFTSCEQMYDLVYITDTVRAIYCAASRGKKNTAYYLGSTKPERLKEFVKIIRDTVDPDIKLYFGELPFNGISLKEEDFDCGKLVEDTGYKPQVSFEDGICMTVEWLKQELSDQA